MLFRLVCVMVIALFSAQVVQAVTNSTIDVKADLYAVGDGNGYLLNTQFATLAAAQAAYPHVHAKWPITSLTSTTHYRDWCAIQEAVLACTDATVTLHREILLPAGTYYIDREIEFKWNGDVPFMMKGAGRRNTFINSYVTSGSTFKIDQNAGLNLKKGGWMRDFTIKGVGNNGSAKGIYLRGLVQYSFDHIGVESFENDGIYILCVYGDDPVNGDPSTYVKFENCFITDNDGWGINVDISDGHNEMSYLTLEHCWLESNGVKDVSGGGMRWRGQICNIRNTGFTVNKNHGFLNYAPTASQMLIMDQTTFENTEGKGVEIQACWNARLTGCQFYNNDTYKGTRGVVIGGTGTYVAENTTILGTVIRATSGNVPYTAFEITGAQAKYTRIGQTRWDVFNTGTQTKYSDSGFLTRIEDEGQEKQTALLTTMSAGGTYTLDSRYTVHALTLGNGSYTISPPNPGAAGLGTLIYLDLVNPAGSGGNSTVNLTGSWSATAPGAITPGTRKSACFYYNQTVGWTQLGAWR